MPAARDDADAQRAVTDYRTLDHAGQRLAWLELRPVTGRTHQLRVHCVALGTPIVGDLKYHEPDQNGARSAIVEGLSNKLHLHARALDLPHPAGGRLRVEADLPPHMRQTFKTMGFQAKPARTRGPAMKRALLVLLVLLIALPLAAFGGGARASSTATPCGPASPPRCGARPGAS